MLWGALHGYYLVINHIWHAIRRRLGLSIGSGRRLGRISARLVTLIAVATAWVLFRAADLETARSMLSSMLSSMVGLNGIGLPEGLAARVEALAPWLIPALWLNFGWTFPHELVYWSAGLPWIGLLLVIARIAPKSNPRLPAALEIGVETLNLGRLHLAWGDAI